MNTPSLESIAASLDAVETVEISRRDGVPEQVHVFDDPGNRSRLAIKSALWSGRPLLVLGEPGVGKTQVAAAAAKVLKRPLESFTVDAASEARDLLWTFDAVRRLAEAQICGSMNVDSEKAEQRLKDRRFVKPGPLWKGFDWNDAVRHCQESGLDAPVRDSDSDPENGRIVLIDEIDKADSDLPNGLLESLGSGEFQPQGCEVVKMGDPPPLILITSNGERALPDAFLRRCLVLRLALPEDEAELRVLLVRRAAKHFPDTAPDLFEEAADMLLRDRRTEKRPRPGQAEYFDLLRAVLNSGVGKSERQNLMKQVAEFTLKKHDAVE